MKTKKCFFIIIGVVLGIFLMGTISYVVAATLINSKDVVYEDNSNLMADNVQDAIDGTCSKIDTRLSGIEDKLYTIKKVSGNKTITSTTEWSYTGLSVTLPANSCCAIDYFAGWWYSAPARILVSKSSTNGPDNSLSVSGDWNNDAFQRLSVSVNECVSEDTTRYIWTKFSSARQNSVGYSGFCAIKYK